MSNPIFDQPSGQPSGIFDMINQVRNAPDPNAAFQTLAANNKGVQNAMNYIQANGGDARSAFYNLAAQRGIDPNLVLRLLR